jgi:hypothetical protein
MSRKHRVAMELTDYAAAVEVWTSEGGHLPTAEGERQMAELAVRRDGGDYLYQGYRYERLADALAYARLVMSRPGADDGPAPFLHKPVASPTDAERTLMISLGIEFDGRVFRFASYRYDRLADAVNYARRPQASASH